MMNVEEFIGKFFKFKSSYVRDDGVEVVKYTPTRDLYVNSLNTETGEIEKAKIKELSIHKNIKLYTIKNKKNRFKPFKVSYDHSLIVYDLQLDTYEKMSPEQLMKFPREILKNLYLIKVNEKTLEKEFIPLTDIEFELYTEKGIAYDYTLDKNYTFIANSIVIQDTMAQYAINTLEARRDLFTKKAHQITQLVYIRNEQLIHKLRHEYLYALYQLSDTNNIENIIEITETKDFTPDKKILFYDDIRKYGVKINSSGITIPYGLMYLNYKVFDTQKYNKLFLTETNINKKKVTVVNSAVIKYLEEIEDLTPEKDIEKFGRRYLDLLHEIMVVLSMFSYNNYVTPKLSINDYITPNKKEIKNWLDMIPNEPIFGLYFLKKFSDIVFKEMERADTNLWKIYQSGARASKEQIEQTIFAKGFLADPNNIVMNTPVKNSLNKGLTKRELFISSYGSRKGEIDKQAQTPRSGFLERIGLFNLPFVIIDENVEDCGTDKHFRIKVKSDTHAKSIIGRYCKLSLDDKKEFLVTKENFQSLIGKEVYLRSPLTCKLGKFKVCKKCGAYESLDRRTQLGLLAVQYITERFTQLILRTFHTSGKAIIRIPYELLDKYELTLTEKGIRIKNSALIPALEKELNKYLRDRYSTYTIKLEKVDENIFVPIGIGKLINDDIVSKIEYIEKIIRTKMINVSLPEAYEKIADTLLEIELFKSIMIETLLATMWFKRDILNIDKSDEIIENILEYTLRYSVVNDNKIKTINDIDYSEYIKLSLPASAYLISPSIQLLFEPNKKTILRLMSEFNKYHVENIFEKIFS